jgi:bacterioferritin
MASLACTRPVMRGGILLQIHPSRFSAAAESGNFRGVPIMQGHPDVISTLNTLLTGELTAVDQYMAHAGFYQDWGFHKLYQHTLHEIQEEQTHANALIARIHLLDGTPDLARRHPLRIGRDVPSMLANDLALEYQVIAELKDAMALCESVRDYQTRDILLVLLRDTEEDHAYWLETQLGLIEKLGLPNYLQSQTGTP